MIKSETGWGPLEPASGGGGTSGGMGGSVGEPKGTQLMWWVRPLTTKG